MLLTLRTVIVVIFSSTYIHQDMIFIAFQKHRSFLISCDLHAIGEASFAKTSEAASVVVVLITLFRTFHAAEIILLLHELFIANKTKTLNRVLLATSWIREDIHQFAVNAVNFLTVVALLWAFFSLLAKLANRSFVDYISVV